MGQASAQVDVSAFLTIDNNDHLVKVDIYSQIIMGKLAESDFRFFCSNLINLFTDVIQSWYE
jgi:hypothetical protein